MLGVAHVIRRSRVERPSPTSPFAACEALERRRLLTVTLTPLVTFHGTNGSKPNALVVDSGGNLFGITAASVVNGAVQGGEIFEIAAGSSTLKVIATLPTSDALGISLIVDSAGNLFGTSNSDGANGTGTIFEIARGTTAINTLASFTTLLSQGSQLDGVDSAGNIFGTNIDGAFELPVGTSTIISLANPDSGASIPNDLVMGTDGNLYGTTANGGLNGDGSVFEILPGNPTPITLGSFDGMDNGGNPKGICIDSNNDLFGITTSGGQFGFGTYFEVPSNTKMITVITSFDGPQSSSGKGFLDSHGNYYLLNTQGGANSFGDIVEIPDGSTTPADIYDLNSNQVASDGDGFAEWDDGILAFLQFSLSGPGGSASANGEIDKLSNSGGGGGGGGGGGTGAVTPTLTGKLPPSVIAGQKTSISEKVTLTNISGAAYNGSTTGKLFLSAGTTVDSSSIELPGPLMRNLKLKAGGKFSFNFKLKSLPSTVPNGTYHLIAQTTDSSGNSSAVASDGIITVAPPQIDLAVSFSRFVATPKNGKDFTETISIANDGNVPAVGLLPIQLLASPDGLVSDAISLTPTTKKINFRPGKSISIPLKLVVAAPDFLIFQIDPNNTFNDINLANNIVVSPSPVTVR